MVDSLREFTELLDQCRCGTVAKLLEDPDPHVRLATASVLASTMWRDERLASTVWGLMEVPHWRLREDAVDLICKVVEPGDLRTLTTLVARLEDECSRVRLKAIEVLGEWAPKDDEAVLVPVLEYLQHEDPWIRRSATDALANLTLTPNRQCTDALEALLKDPNGMVSLGAAEALGLI